MKRTTSLLILIIASIGVLSCNYESAEPEIHLIPEGYSGPVLIIFDDLSTDFLTYEGDARVYKIPENGMLRTKSFQNERIVESDKIQYFYLMEDGTRLSIKKAFFAKNLQEEIEYIFNPQVGVAYSNTDNSMRPYKSYLVSTPIRKKEAFDKLRTLEDSVLFE